MATRAQKAKVLFFILFCVGLMAGGLALIKGFTHVPTTQYRVEFSESVLGLYPGAYVVYQGVPVGKVRDLDVQTNGKAMVLIDVQTNKVTLRQGVKAQMVLYSLATGSLAVNLYGGDPEGEPLPEGALIESEMSFLGAAGEQTSVLLKNLSDVADAVSKSLHGIEEGDFARLIKHTEELVAEAKDTLETVKQNIDQVGENVNAGTQSFQDLAADLKATSQNTRALAEELKTKIAAVDTAQLNNEMLRVLENGNVLLARLQETATNLEKAAGNVLHDTQNMELELRSTLEGVRDTVTALRDLVEYLREDPSALVRGKGKATGGR